MQCPRCRHESRTGGKFCQECGAPLTRRCAACGSTVEPTAKFCPECGRLIEARESDRYPSPEAYTPRHLAEKILSTRAELEGERKQVTVLFADLKGSMEMLGDDVDDARALLDDILQRMMEAVHRFEGTVNQVMGDGIMALFGAPLAHEDHAVRGCYAALRMQESVTRYAADVQRRLGVPVMIRVGLNSGEVIVRSISTDLRMDYTAVGQTTHLAARMEQMAMPGSILVTPTVAALAKGFVELRPLGPVQIKGVPQPISVHELRAAVGVRTRLQARAERDLTRFVGRRTELQLLEEARERTVAGRGQIVGLVGEPGVGKSRLVWELVRSRPFRDWRILESGAISYGKATPYLPIVAMLRRYFDIEPGDDPPRVREKVSAKVTGLDRTLASALPPILSLFDVPVDDPEWVTIDAGQRRQRTVDAVRRVLIRESQAQPVLIVLEDLHWIDSSSQTVLDALVESLPAAHMLVVVNYRPEYEHAWGSRTYYCQIRIDPLPATSADELLGAILGDDRELIALKSLLVERTEGNPFFLEECVQSLVEAGALGGERGAHRLVGPIDQIRIPPTVQSVLAARIDRLAPEVKRLLQCASVVGRDVPSTVLMGIADEPAESVRLGLATLQSGEFLYESRLFPEVEYTFKHALTHDVAYTSLPRDRRRDLHASIARTLEGLPDETRADHVDRLAHHTFQGEVWTKAVGYLRESGLKALGRLAFREAAAAFDQALVAVERSPDRADRLEQAIDLRFALRNALAPQAEYERIRIRLEEAQPLAEALGDPARLGRLYNYMAGLL